MKRDINFVNAFPHYASIQESDLVRPARSLPSSDVVENTNPLVLHIFAPDPDTGLPSSDLGIIMSRDTAPEVAQFIRDNLMTVRKGDGVGVDDPELAIGSIRNRGERLIDYAERLRNLVDSSLKAE